MYRTSEGERILQGAERKLFVHSLAMLTDQLDMFDYESELPVFCDLEKNQKIAALAAVGRALLDEDQRPVRLTAYIEATVAVVYEHIRSMVEWELLDDEEDSVEGFEIGSEGQMPTWREMILAACRECGVAGPLPKPDEDDFGEWDYLIESLESRILWDHDWALGAALDLSPERSRLVKQRMGITPDYFTAIPPDPTDEEAQVLIDELTELTAASRFEPPPAP